MFDFDSLCAIMALAISLIAIFQTEKGMLLSKKQSLFEKRLETFFMCQKFLEFYEMNKSLLEKDISSPKNIEKIYNTWEKTFFIKNEMEFEKIRKSIQQISFLYKSSYAYFLQNFLNQLLFFCQKLYFTHEFLEKIETIKTIKKVERAKLKEYFIENTWNATSMEEREMLASSYQYIQKRKIMQKLKREIKMF